MHSPNVRSFYGIGANVRFLVQLTHEKERSQEAVDIQKSVRWREAQVVLERLSQRPCNRRTITSDRSSKSACLAKYPRASLTSLDR